jgi:structural maintenance of chromosome 1
VLDEVDAALDNANVVRVADYVQKHKNDFQSIVISLKDTFYHRADALVGIYRDTENQCSRVLTMDLTSYQ